MTQRRSVLQDWVQQLTFMQQSVLLSSIRGADGLHKDHISKYILRWLRRCVLISAFDGCALTSPTTPGGGSFTGPLKHPKVEKWDYVNPNLAGMIQYDSMVLKHVSEDYLRSTDEIPHHFHMHVVHAAEILGYKHPINWIADWWHDFYLMLASDAHLHPETETEMDRRLGDVEAQWKEREAVPAADVPKVKEELVKDSVVFNEKNASYLAGRDMMDTLWVFSKTNALKMSLKDATEFVDQSHAKEHLVIKGA